MAPTPRKRIVQIGPAHPLRGGNVLFAAHMYEALSADYDVHGISYSRLYPNLLFPGTRQTDVSTVAIKPHPAEAIIDSVNPLTWHAAARRVVELKPDLVLFNWWNPFFGAVHHTIAKAVKHKTDAITMFVCENLISHESRGWESFMTKYALQYGDVFMALSAAVKHDIETMFPGRPVYQTAVPIYDCYEMEPGLSASAARQRLGIQSKHVILFFGYIREYKGLDVLIAAMPEILKSVPDAHLLIVGESYEPIKKYEDLIDAHGIRANTTLINRFVANEEVGQYYAASDVVVLPYRSATQSGILNIAYGFGKPVIVTDVGGLGEFVVEGKTGFLIPPEQPGAIASSVVKFYREYADVDFAPAIFEHNRENDFEKLRDQFAEIFARGPIALRSRP